MQQQCVGDNFGGFLSNANICVNGSGAVTVNAPLKSIPIKTKISRDENGVKFFSCMSCDFHRTSLQEYYDHMRLIHSCNRCEKCMEMHSNIAAHMDERHKFIPNAPQCNNCNRKFKKLRDLRNHEKTCNQMKLH